MTEPTTIPENWRSSHGLLASLLSNGFDRSYQTRDDSGRYERACRVRCSQCDARCVNGVPCHERGCPNTPRDTNRED